MAPQEQWTAVDNYFSNLLLPHDDALESALRDSAAAGLPHINVSPTQGKFLHLLARIQGSRRILEIGTLGGYSTIWLARALPADGQLITLEAVERHATVAGANIARAGLSSIVDIRLGKALDTLPTLTGPFDLIFIDADKQNVPAYFTWSLKLSRAGTIILVDNVVRKGAIIDANSRDPDVHGIRRFNDMVANEPRVSATALQTVGVKGYDGFTIALVIS